MCECLLFPEPFVENYYVLRKIEEFSVYSEERDQDAEETLNCPVGKQA